MRIFGLDVLRTLAIGQVLAGHGLSLYLGQGAKTSLEGFYGFLGVEVFFVLSGFLVGGIALEVFERNPTAAGFGDFVVRRWLRTLPNYYLFLLVNVGLGVWLGYFTPDPRYLVFLQNLAWPAPAFFGESWSLTVEELFYLCLPIILLGAAALTRTRGGVLRALCLCLVVFTAGRLAYVGATHADFHAVVRKTAVLRLDALLYGVLAAWAARYAPRPFRRYRVAAFAAGVACTIAAVRGVVVLAPLDAMGASIALCGVSIGVALTLPLLSSWTSAPGPWRQLFGWLSRISYSLYLCHLPASRLLAVAGFTSGWVAMAAWLACSCLVATAVYVVFERPIMNLRDRLPSGPARTRSSPPVDAAAG